MPSHPASAALVLGRCVRYFVSRGVLEEQEEVICLLNCSEIFNFPGLPSLKVMRVLSYIPNLKGVGNRWFKIKFQRKSTHIYHKLFLFYAYFFETTKLSRCGGLMCNFVFLLVRLISRAEDLGAIVAGRSCTRR